MSKRSGIILAGTTGLAVIAAAVVLFDFVLPASASARSATPPALSLAPLIEKAGLQAVRPGVKIIDFKLQTPAGAAVSLSSYAGKVILLNFWATWCPPCRNEIPSIESLYTKFKDQGFVVLGVDLQEDPASVSDFVKKYAITYPVVLDQTGQVASQYGARGIPLSFLIDRKGQITSGAIGGREWSGPETEALVKALLSQS